MINLINAGFKPIIPGETPDAPFLSWCKDLKLLAVNHTSYVTFFAIDKLPFDYELSIHFHSGKRPWNAKREKAIYGSNGHIVASKDSEIGVVIRWMNCLIDIYLPKEAEIKEWTVGDAA